MLDKLTVNYNGEEFEIKKIPLRRYPALATAVFNIPEVILDVLFDNGKQRELNAATILEKFPTVFLQASETLPALLAVASGIDLEKVLDGGLDDALALLQGILQINNFDTIVNYLKNFKVAQ